MLYGRYKHKTIQMGGSTLIAGLTKQTEFFDNQHNKFHLVTDCPIETYDFGMA